MLYAKSRGVQGFKKVFALGDAEGLTSEAGSGKINVNKIEAAYGEARAREIEAKLNDAPEVAKNVWNRYADKIKFLTIEHKGLSNYNPSNGKIAMNLKLDERDDDNHKKYATTFHEIGHLIDNNANIDNNGAGISFASNYNGGEFEQSIKDEANGYINEKWKELKAQAADPKSVKKYYAQDAVRKELSEIDNRVGDVSDIFDGATGGAVKGNLSHSKTTPNYWKTTAVSEEAFAEMFSATVNNPKSLENIKRYFPKSYNIFLEILGRIGK